MKQVIKNILASILVCTLFYACTSSKNATAPRKEVRGAWTLSNVTFTGVENPDQLKIQLFDDGDIQCFSGSTWNLPNNGFGSYTITKTNKDCAPGMRNINWSYRQENGETIFQFKKLQEGVKSKNIEDGYKFRIISASDDQLVLQSVIAFEGKDLNLSYNFVRSL